MVAYSKEEMVGITELTKSLGKYLDVVTSSALNKLAIVRRNKPEAVIVPIEEYERMRIAADYIEDMEIAEVIEKRVFNRKEPAKMITQKEMENYFKKRGIENV